MKKVGLLVLALVIALGGLGVGYAMWSDTITVTGTVDTATVCFQWSSFDDSDMCLGTEGDRPTATPVPGKDPKWAAPGSNDRYWDKNVACTEIEYYEDEDGKVDPQKLLITVYNAYPGYYADWELHWMNCGTIPIRIQDFTIEPLNFKIASNTNWQNPEADGEIYINFVDDVIGDQLHPGDESSASFTLLVMQTAEQGMGMNDTEPYKFLVTMQAVQWNEYQDPDE